MADDVSASVIALHQARPTKAKRPAERARAYRERKKSTLPAVVPAPAPISTRVTPRPPEAVTFSVTPSRGPDPLDRRRACARRRRDDHEWMVCPVARIDRDL